MEAVGLQNYYKQKQSFADVLQNNQKLNRLRKELNTTVMILALIIKKFIMFVFVESVRFTYQMLVTKIYRKVSLIPKFQGICCQG